MANGMLFGDSSIVIRKKHSDSGLNLEIQHSPWPLREDGYFFISKLVELTPPGLLTQTDNSGDTALHAAAELGNVKTADLLVNKKQELLSFSNNKGLLPIQVAANRDHREMTSYLLSFGMRDEIYYNLLKGAAGLNVLRSLINARYFDLALDLIKFNPKSIEHLRFTLELMADDTSAFRSGTYSCPETPGRLWKMLEVLVQPMKRIRQKKLKHYQALQLVKFICSHVKNLGNESNDVASSIFKGPFLLAAQNGVEEIVAEILDSFPASIDFTDEEEKHSVFHLAVIYRREKVLKVLLEKNVGRDKMFLTDRRNNNILHLAGYRPAIDLPDHNRGAIFQMQHELKWFKKVESLLTPKEIKSKNREKKTPLAIFNEQHAKLAASEIQWTTGMASACSVVASLIVTVAFAAAITVPGGNDSDGLPILSNQMPFLVFAISDSLALVSSVTSVLSFLSIFTSRYGFNDFLNTLPNRLVVGLVSLFFSVTYLMFAFSSTVFLVFAKKNPLILIPIITIASVPVIFFIKLQLPPLLNMVNSTYGPSIFGQ
ncbi:ankyrin repeat-containing protein ITN1-like [Olea europaea var. sylvestris]|uniref:ankyrin repeat-containing protein ITN1-like n=1 Tax=Olea europaea var. sylvestris TaxID=158386 RepID=UPI000C1CCE8D|nr:ankyrin repeat-containing protein ITN1-like [Olea europaea var. sylvestris]